MLDRLRKTGWKQVVAALYALAMIMLGFAHMPVAAVGGPAGAEVVALSLPDGTLPVVCGQSRPDTPSQNHAANHCDACQLTSAPGALPSPPTLLDAPRLAMKLPPVRVIASVAAAQTLDPQSRGPPLFS